MMRWVIWHLVMSVVLGISAVRFGSDSSSNDITLFFDGSVSKYTLLLQANFEYMKLAFSVCFRLRPVVALG